jgi:hypothetical protein
MYEERARAALAYTSTLINRFGPRLAGGEACLGCADALLEAAQDHADRSSAEDFKMHPGAFLGFIRVLVVLFLLSVLALPLAPVLSAALMSAGMAILVLEFMLYKELIDPFYPARTGRNVSAMLEPTGPVTRQLLISGHHDSARVFNFYVDQPEKYALRVYGGIGSFALLWIASLGLSIANAAPLALAIAALAFLADFVLVLPLWRFAGAAGTPGAGDNLAASAAALEMLKELKSRRDEGRGLNGTRIIFLSFDAEEAGLRGARAWARANAELLAAAPSWHYNMDCLYSARDARFLTSDINGSVRLSAPLAQACADAARGAGVDAAVEPIAFLTGGTDAAETAKAGVRATTLIAMQWSNEQRSSVYHTPADDISAVEPAAVELAIRVGLRLAERLDAGELD